MLCFVITVFFSISVYAYCMHLDGVDVVPIIPVSGCFLYRLVCETLPLLYFTYTTGIRLSDVVHTGVTSFDCPETSIGYFGWELLFREPYFGQIGRQGGSPNAQCSHWDWSRSQMNPSPSKFLGRIVCFGKLLAQSMYMQKQKNFLK